MIFLGSWPALLMTSAAASWLCPPGELDTPIVTVDGSFFIMRIKSLPVLIDELPGTENTTCSVTKTASGVTSSMPTVLKPVIRLVISGNACTET